MAKLNDGERKGLIDNLINGGCGCWTEGERATLNTLSDERLQGLVANAKKNKELEGKEAQRLAVENAAKEGAKGLTANQGQTTTPAKPLSTSEWMALSGSSLTQETSAAPRRVRVICCTNKDGAASTSCSSRALR